MTKEQLDSITDAICEDSRNKSLKFVSTETIYRSKALHQIRAAILYEYPQLMLSLSPADLGGIISMVFEMGFAHGERWAATKQLEDLVR